MNEFVTTFRARVDTATREPGIDAGPLHEVRDLLAGDVPIRLYRPTPDPRPLVCYVHGAGFIAGDLDSHDQICRLLAVRARCTVVAIDYRLAPEHPFPAAVEDTTAAVEWIREHAEQLGATSSRWAIAGDSAGGTLSAVVAQRWAGRAEGPALQVLVCPALEFENFDLPSHHEFATTEGFNTGVMREMGELYLAGADRSDPTASPARAALHPGIAPAVIISAELDPLRDDGEHYARRLIECGVPVTVFRHLQMVHYGVLWCRAAPQVGPGIDLVCGALADTLDPRAV